MESLLKGNVIPYGVTCSQIPQNGLIASYLLQGTAESETGSFNGTESAATYVYNDKRGIVYNGGGSITIPATGGSDCTYWVDTGTGWTFTHTTTIPSTLTTNKYSNLHIYNRVLSSAEATFIQDLEQYQHNNPLDHGLIAYYPLDGNSLDNAINQYDGTDTSVSYVSDPTFGIVLDCGAGNVGLPTATGHARTYYWENTGSGWVHNNTTTEITSLTTNKYAHVRKYNRTISDKELSILQDVEYGLLCPEGSIINNPDPFEDGSGIALYKLDGNANDTTGVYNGTPTNVTYADGEFGQSAVFINGSGGTIDLGSALLEQNYTVSMWIKHNTLIDGAALFTQYRTVAVGRHIVNSNANGGLQITTSGTNSLLDLTATPFITGVWQHLVVVKNSSSGYTVYIDGSAIGTWSSTENIITDQSTEIGGDVEWGTTHTVDGAIDQVRIFNRVLTANEITVLYNERKV